RRRADRRARAALPDRPVVPARGPAGGRLPAHAAALVRDASPGRRGGPARGPGAARAREPGHHAGLHPRVRRPPPCRVHRRPSAGETRDPRRVVRTRMTDARTENAELPEGGSSGGGLALARAGLIVSGAYLVARVLGYVRVVVIGSTLGAGPDVDAFFAAFRIPDLIFQLVAAGTV